MVHLTLPVERPTEQPPTTADECAAGGNHDWHDVSSEDYLVRPGVWRKIVKQICNKCMIDREIIR